MAQRDPGPIPNRWLKCPRKSTGLIAEKFIAFKTPLGSQFNDKVPEQYRFTPSMLFTYMKTLKIKLGLWIDLTNTDRFYDKKEIEDMDCKYIKIKCRGHGETPSEDQTNFFIRLVTNFISKKPLEMIAVHCTHGFNRTGFLLVSYMINEMDFSVDAALSDFAKLRSPGIYKQDYLDELYRRYDDDVRNTRFAPERPDWCDDDEDIDYDDEDQGSSSQGSDSSRKHKKKGRRETTHKKAVFMHPVQGVEPFDTQPRLHDIQKKTQHFCGWKSTGFPGSQPVSMDMKNIKKLTNKPYRVSWKADGARYMMLIDGEDEVYLIDRDNCAFKVFGLKFLYRKDLSKHLTDTLLDGEMVIDKVNGQEFPRYLCYDVIRFMNHDVGKESFFPVRLSYIENEIVNPRHEAMKKGILKKETEPFGFRLKQFWELPMAHRLLGEKFSKSLCHEPDGLIFQPSKEPYVSGTCDDVLKWKPIHMNSVDFKLVIETEDKPGMLRRKVGWLYVANEKTPFSSMNVTKSISNLNNKIIECSFNKEKNSWEFMRERTDKSFPNSAKTALAVCQSIENPVTEKILLDVIDHERYYDDTERMPPPKRIRIAC